MKSLYLSFFTVFIMSHVGGQDTKHVSTIRRTADNTRPPISSILTALPIRNIGPYTQGCGYRINDIAVYEADPTIFYYASANGGVLKTTNRGRTSRVVFDKIGSASIGAVAVSQKDPNLVWVGTGDRWQRNSVGFGDGVYKSIDGGTSWECMGLKESVSIGRIAIHPKNNDIIFIAVMGSPWGYGPDRGIYKTKDGGKTWKKVVYVDERTAGVDVIIDPKNPNNVLASMWDHIHRPWGYFPTGASSGIFRSTDGGETWHRITTGLPKNHMGRIALDYFRHDPKHVVAAIEAAYPATGIYRSMDGGVTWKEMPAIHYDDEGKIIDQKKQSYWYRPHYNQVIRFCTKDVNTIYHGNINHFSKNGGKTWKGGTNDCHELWINPNDPGHSLYAGDNRLLQQWVSRSGNVIKEFVDVGVSLFQTYGCGFDMRKLYWVMGNAQDCGNGVMVPSQGATGGVYFYDVRMVNGSELGRTIADPQDWTSVYSTGATRTDLKTWKFNRPPRFGSGYNETPEKFEQYQKAEVKLRQAPREAPGFELSPWDSKTIYLGTNVLHKSTDKGLTWHSISPDLTHNKAEWQVLDGSVYENSGGVTSYQSIVSISESPVRRDMIWIGTDCGYVQLTMDGGKTWSNVTKNIPGVPDTSWTSKIYASRHSDGRAYVVFDNHRNFDLKPYVYVTEDFGMTWKKINSNLPDREPCRAIQEGLKNPDLLFVGTEFGLWVSLDRGTSWNKYQDNVFGNYLPSVAVHDLAIHPRELDLIIGTHGRGYWILPVRALEELTTENLFKDVHFASPGAIYLFPDQASGFFNQYIVGDDKYDQFFITRNTQPGTQLSFYLTKVPDGDAIITITDSAGTNVYNNQFPLKGNVKTGLTSIRIEPNQARQSFKTPGNYRVTLTIGGTEYYQNLKVEDATSEVIAGLPE